MNGRTRLVESVIALAALVALAAAPSASAAVRVDAASPVLARASNLPAAASGQTRPWTLTVNGGTAPIPSGFQLVASDSGRKADNWFATPKTASVDNPVAIDIRVVGTGNPSTDADAICSDARYNLLPDSERVFKGIGLFTLPFPAGAANCGVVVTATGSRGAFTVQVYVQTGTSTTPTPTPTPAPTTTTSNTGASPYCVQSNAGSSGGWNYYRYVDSTSTVPCYGHWNITLGPGCQFYLNGVGPYSTGPGNIWNIVSWGFGHGGAVAYLNDRRVLSYTCFTNLSSYPQTSLNATDWR